MTPGRRALAATVAAAAVAAWAVPGTAWAHGIGVRGDLPLPLWVVTYGSIGVLVVSFLLLVRLWRRPVLARLGPGWAAPPPVSRGVAGLEWPLRVLGVVALATVLGAAFAGSPDPNGNLAPFAIYVGLWVGVALANGLLGDLYRWINPLDTVAVLLERGDIVDDDPLLERLGHWPAAATILSFVWIELVHPDPAAPRVLAVAIAVYLGVTLLPALRLGPGWIRRADGFGVVFSLLARMGPFHRDEQGRLRVRPPIAGLAHLEPLPGTAAVILVVLGSTSFDGLQRTDLWAEITGDLRGWDLVPISTLGMAVMIALVAGLYVGAAAHAASRSGRGVRDLVPAFAHSLVPIVFGYAVAHYFSLVVFEGQRMLALASDPFAQGWDLLGTGDWVVDFTVVSTTAIAAVQVAGVVLGHVAGVVLAHDRAVELFPPEHATRSQQALLVAMVGYTVGALVLLLGA